MNDLGPLKTLKQLKEANNITSMGNGRLRVRKPLVPFTSQLETARENNNLIDNSIRSTGNNSHQTTGNNWTSKTRQNGGSKGLVNNELLLGFRSHRLEI